MRGHTQYLITEPKSLTYRVKHNAEWLKNELDKRLGMTSAYAL